jgi:hypothetical protein
MSITIRDHEHRIAGARHPQVVAAGAVAATMGGSAWWTGIFCVTCLATAATFWAVSLPRIDPAGLDSFGLISVLPWTHWAALASLGIGFSISLSRRLAAGPLPFFFLVGLVLLLHATPAITYETLRHSWAWKHIGIVDYIQRHGSVDPASPYLYLAAYHNWPGFFIVSALIANLLGLGPIELAQIARFAPTTFNLLFLCALLPIFRRFSDDPRLVWTAAWIFLASNWVGQDYFSPQGAVFFLYLVMLGFCLGPLQTRRGLSLPGAGGFARIAGHMFQIVSRGLPAPTPLLGGIGQAACAAAVLLIILAITASHQLTPLVVISALAGLALIGRLSPSYCLFAMIAEVAWLLYFAVTFMTMALHELITEFGHTATGMFEKMVDTSLVNPGQVWISWACRGLTGGIAVTAFLGGLRRLAAGYRDGPAIVLALAVLPLLGVTSYGGEILFRVFLFALPFLAFFAAALFFPSPRSGHSLILRTLVCGFGLLLTFAFVLANNGRDRQDRFTPDEIAAAQWLYESAPPGTLLIEGARNYPSKFVNYENFDYLPISEEPPESIAAVLRDPVEVLGRWLNDPGRPAAFIIITRGQKFFTDAQNIMPNGGLAKIEQALLASPRFKLVYATADARIFELNPATRAMGAWTQ